MSGNTEIKIDRKTSFDRDLLILSNEDSEINHLINGEISSIEDRINRYFIQGDSDKDARRGLYNRIENRKERRLINGNYSIISDKYYLSYFYNTKNRTLIFYNIEKISENKKKPWIILVLLVLLFLQTILSLMYFLWLICFKQIFLVTSIVDKRLLLILILLAGAIYSVVSVLFLFRNEWTKKRWTVYPKSIFGKLKVWNLEASVNKISSKALVVITIILFIQLLLSTLFPLLQPQNVISQIFDVWKYVLYILFVVFISVAYFLRGISFRVLIVGGVIFYIAGLLDTSAWAAITPVLSIFVFLCSDEIWKLTPLMDTPLSDVESKGDRIRIEKKIFKWKVLLTIVPSLFYLYLDFTKNLKLFSCLTNGILRTYDNFFRLINLVLDNTLEERQKMVSSLFPQWLERGIDRLLMVPLIFLIVISIIKLFDKNDRHLVPVSWLRVKLSKIKGEWLFAIVDKLYSIEDITFYNGKAKKEVKKARKFPTRRRKH